MIAAPRERPVTAGLRATLPGPRERRTSATVQDHEGEAAEKEQQEADRGDRRLLVGRGVVGEALIERQANASDHQHQQDPEER